MAWTRAVLDDIRSADALSGDVAWLEACAAVDGGRPLVLRSGDLFWPLSVRRRSGLVVIENMGQAHRSRCGPVGENGGDRPPLETRAVGEGADVVDLRRVPQQWVDAVWPDNRQRLARFDIAQFQRRLEGSPEAFLKSLSKGTRKEFQNARNRIEKDFGADAVRVEAVALRPSNFDAVWEKAKTIAPHSWKGKEGLSVLVQERPKALVRALVANGMSVRFHFCHIGTRLAAVAVSMEKDGRVFVYCSEYDASFGKYRPGSVLRLELIKRALEAGPLLLDLGVGDTDHKQKLCCERHALWRVLVPLTWKGWMAVKYQQMRWTMGNFIPRPENGKTQG